MEKAIMKRSPSAHTTAGEKISARAITLACALLIITTFLAGRAVAQKSAPEQPKSNADATTQSAPRGHSTVRGRVFYEDTGRPLSRASVTVFRMDDTPHGYEATTNESGEFSVGNLPAGQYTVTLDDPEIIDTQFFYSRADATNTPNFKVDGTNSSEVQVRVRRGGSVTGRVTRADGKPAVDAKVQLLFKRGGRARPFSARGIVQTDKHGFYRASGLPTGEYVVSADLLRLHPLDPNDESSPRVNLGTLSATFYPSATDISNATHVHVEAGSETSGINITLIERTAYRISGTLKTRRGTLLAPNTASISLIEKDESGGSSTNRQMKEPDAQGRWSFEDVPDGTYILDIIPHGKPSLDAAGKKDHDPLQENLIYPFIHNRREVKVAGDDLTELAIEVEEGATISGVVEMEGGQSLPADLNIVPEANYYIRVSSRIRPDGTFYLKGIPAGNVYLNITSTSSRDDHIITRNGDYYVKSIFSNGVDLLSEPFKLQEGEEIKGVRVVLSPNVGTVTGRVRLAKDSSPVSEMNVVLLSTDPARQRVVNGISFGFTNAAGAFSVNGAPGEYAVVAFGSSDLPLTDEKVKALVANAPRVTLQANERKSVDLTVPGSK
jgi:Carboxypeptidase regulatory-like domain